MSKTQERAASKRLAIFDGAKHMTVDAAIPSYLIINRKFKPDYRAAHAFLYACKDNVVTFNAYRREIVQCCFDRAISMMEKAGFEEEEIADLRYATVHWLRHAGISEDVKRRPFGHVKDDAGHSNSQITDRSIDINCRDRHRSARKKPIANGLETQN